MSGARWRSTKQQRSGRRPVPDADRGSAEVGSSDRDRSGARSATWRGRSARRPARPLAPPQPRTGARPSCASPGGLSGIPAGSLAHRGALLIGHLRRHAAAAERRVGTRAARAEAAAAASGAGALSVRRVRFGPCRSCARRESGIHTRGTCRARLTDALDVLLAHPPPSRENTNASGQPAAARRRRRSRRLRPSWSAGRFLDLARNRSRPPRRSSLVTSRPEGPPLPVSGRRPGRGATEARPLAPRPPSTTRPSVAADGGTRHRPTSFPHVHDPTTVPRGGLPHGPWGRSSGVVWPRRHLLTQGL
jgi:hypothetical protein